MNIAFACETNRMPLANIPNQKAAMDAFHARGWKTHDAAWDDENIDWAAFDAIIIRATWDYIQKPDAYTAWVRRTAAQNPRFFNPADAVLWNIEKTYLRNLADGGIATIPSFWMTRGQNAMDGLDDFLDRISEHDDFLVKPTIGCGGSGIEKISRAVLAQNGIGCCAEILKKSGAIIQPFIPEIDKGEWSLVYFGGAFSHAILKIPAHGAYKCQKQHGGTIQARTAPPHIRHFSDTVMAAIPHDLLYARIDILDTRNGPYLVEVEINEPGLFESFHPAAGENLATALAQRI